MNVILLILLFTSLACIGLLAAWATISPRYWFLRTAIFLGPPLLLLLIPAYEPCVVFVIQGTIVAAGVQIGRWWRADLSSKKPFRFSLATLLCVMVLLAVGLTVGMRIPELG